ncbi:MAG: HlyC/CorC family transporter [Deltaproteobacteria bacterium]|nr:HlyC/CorC family transporter [Deltaproteobacteria bacterium]
MPIETLLLEAFLIFVLILINGFFSTAEIALITARKSIIDKLSKEGSSSAKLVAKLKEDPERFLATVQIGITVVGTLASVTGGIIAVEVLKPLLASIPYAPIQNIAEPLAIGVVVSLLSFAILVIGELAPKSLALRYTEKIACASARPINLLSKLSSILVGILTTSTALVLRIFGIRGKPKGIFVSEDEIKFIITEGHKKGVLEETEAAILHSVFEFADTTAGEVMVSKPKFKAIEISTPADEVLKFISETGFSRYPIYKDNLDHIVGILFNKDIFKVMEKKEEIILKDLIREPYFVPNSIMISRLLREMQRQKTHIAIAVDEQGDVDGLVTIEDILEEIVGEIEDEYDALKVGLIEHLKDGTLIIDASASLRDLVEAGLPFNTAELEEHPNLAAFMLAKLQRIPRGGEFVIHQNHRMTVVDIEGKRIEKVKVEALGGNGGTIKPLVNPKTTKPDSKDPKDKAHQKKISG